MKKLLLFITLMMPIGHLRKEKKNRKKPHLRNLLLQLEVLLSSLITKCQSLKQVMNVLK